MILIEEIYNTKFSIQKQKQSLMIRGLVNVIPR